MSAFGRVAARLTDVRMIIMLRTSYVNTMSGMSRENRTARLTLLVDPDKKAVFENLCRLEDLTPSQVVRQLIRTYIEQKLGRPWKPGEPAVPSLPKENRDHAKKPPIKERR